MELKTLLKDIDVLGISGSGSGEVSAVCYDSRKCAEGALFVAVSGFKSDGHDYITTATAAGAKFVVHEKAMDVLPGVTMIRVADSRRALGLLGKNFYRDPSSELQLIGITGTNGKTTITFLLESIFKAAGFYPGVIGTINYRYGDKILAAPNTTPESLDLQRILREMVDAGVTHVAMEVSSHALALERVADCRFRAGIFTNLTQDHLDYHKTMEAYFLAKKRLFEMLNRGGDGSRSLVNSDDPWGERLIREIKTDKGTGALSYGLERLADITAIDPVLSIEGIQALIKMPEGAFAIRSPLIGKFNLYNILSAVAAAYVLKVPIEAIQEGIKRLKNIPGRMEKVSRSGEPTVFVDYAHTEDALRRALQNIAEFKTNKVITVFGCGGDRDRGKRPLMGRASLAYSDLTILTSDNPRSEDPAEILREIEQGINGDANKCTQSELEGGASNSNWKKAYAVIADRKTAIATALRIAGPADIVLVAGKGHENYQIIGSVVSSFDDRIVSREILNERFKSGGWS